MSTNNALNNTAVTQSPGDNTTNVATTAFVTNAVSGAGGGSLVAPPISAASAAIGTGFAFVCTPGLFSSTTFSDTQTDGLNTYLSGSVVFVPFFSFLAYSPTQIRCNVKTSVAASTVTMGLYASDANGLPTGSTIAVGQVATTGTGSKAVSGLTMAMSANKLYWFAIQGSTSTTLALSTATLAVNQGINMNNGPGTTFNNRWLAQTNSYSAGTLPTIGTLVAFSGSFVPSLPCLWIA